MSEFSDRMKKAMGPLSKRLKKNVQYLADQWEQLSDEERKARIQYAEELLRIKPPVGSMVVKIKMEFLANDELGTPQFSISPKTFLSAVRAFEAGLKYPIKPMTEFQ